MPFARAAAVLLLLRLRLDVTHSNTIAIDSKVASDCLTAYRSRQGFTHVVGRSFTSMQAQARFRKLVRRVQRHVCKCGNVANSDATRFRCLDVNVVLAAESFAEVNAASNAVSERVHIAI